MNELWFQSRLKEIVSLLTDIRQLLREQADKKPARGGKS